MWRDRRPDELDRLSRFWDARVSGYPPSEQERAAPDLDPTLVETVERLHSRDDARLPAPVFLDRLEQTLMETAASALPGFAPLRPLRPIPTNGRIAPTPHRQRPTRLPVFRERGRWAVAQLATALLLIVSLAAGFLAFGPARQRPAVAPPAEPPPIVGSEEVEIVPLMWVTTDALPGATGKVWLARTTVAPGADGAILALGGGVPAPLDGPYLARVEAGALTIRADDPVRITRAATGPLDAPVTTATTEATLGIGDWVAVPTGVAHTFRNDGQTPAVLLAAWIASSVWKNPSPGIRTDVLGPSSGRELPAPPVAIMVGLATLAPGAILPAPEAGIQVVGMDPERAMELRRRSDGSARNAGASALDVYVLTVQSAQIESVTMLAAPAA